VCSHWKSAAWSHFGLSLFLFTKGNTSGGKKVKFIAVQCREIHFECALFVFYTSGHNNCARALMCDGEWKPVLPGARQFGLTRIASVKFWNNKAGERYRERRVGLLGNCLLSNETLHAATSQKQKDRDQKPWQGDAGPGGIWLHCDPKTFLGHQTWCLIHSTLKTAQLGARRRFRPWVRQVWLATFDKQAERNIEFAQRRVVLSRKQIKRRPPI